MTKPPPQPKPRAPEAQKPGPGRGGTPKRQPPDWPGIEREYRVGQLSLAELSRRFDVSRAAIRKRAAKHGWQRDLSDQVRATVAAKVQRHLAGSASQGSPVPSPEPGGASRARESDAQIVDGAGDRGASAVIEHLSRNAGLKLTFAVLHYRLDLMIGLQRPPPDCPAGVTLIDLAPQAALLQGKGDSVAAQTRALADLADRIQRSDRLSLSLDVEDKERGRRPPDLSLDVDPDLTG